MTRYGYTQSADRKTLEILDPQRRVLASIAITANCEQAMKDAQFIMLALNAYHHGDIRKMTTEQLEKHVSWCYSRLMYEQAAERGWDREAAAAASADYWAAKEELDRWTEPKETIAEIAEELKQAVEALTGGAA
jgi:hypothetical protein